MRYRMIFAWILVVAIGPGCLVSGLSQVETDPGFDWDTLKRDQILMAPLMDLRRDPAAQPFFTDPERLRYAETFKQTFFKLRKDIRVFGAGGAFEHVAGVPDLAGVAARVLAKEPLPPTEVQRLVSGMQEIRFLFFLAVTEETLAHDVQYVFRRDQELDVKRYMSRRSMTLKLALWDSQANKTVWIGTERLTPTATSSYEVRNPSKRRKKQGDRFIWVGSPERMSLASELARHPERFPPYPAREPNFSASFDDFALALPIQPSEAKLIEYTHFTYHRPELLVRTSALGDQLVPSLQLGTSSVINYRFRFGGALALPLGGAEVERDGVESFVTATSYGVTFDYEWELSERVRLLSGMMVGGTTFVVDELDERATAEDESESPSISDGTLHLWPRVYLLFGAKDRLQWGVGATARFFDGIEEPAVKAVRPSAWGLDLGVAYAFRGF